MKNATTNPSLTGEEKNASTGFFLIVFFLLFFALDCLGRFVDERGARRRLMERASACLK